MYARFEDEYELKERGEALKRKLNVIVETARALTDIIVAELAATLYQIYAGATLTRRIRRADQPCHRFTSRLRWRTSGS